jgi:hypothetical protein
VRAVLAHPVHQQDFTRPWCLQPLPAAAQHRHRIFPPARCSPEASARFASAANWQDFAPGRSASGSMRTGRSCGSALSGVAAPIFVFWGRPTGAVVIGIALVLLVILGLIELIGRPPAASSTQAPRASS